MSNATATKSTVALLLAASHVTKGAMASSAALRLSDARVCADHGCHREAIGAAVDSLAYSVGVFHLDHEACKALLAA